MKQTYKKVLRKVAHFQTNHPFITIALLLAITIVFIGGANQVRTVAALENMMPSDIEEIQAFNELRDATLGQDMIAIIVRVNRESSDQNGVMDITDYRVYDYISSLTPLLQKETDILSVHAYSDVLHGASQQQSLSENKYSMFMSDTRLQQDLSSFINSDKTTTIILAKTDVSADDARMNMLATNIKHHLESVGHPSGVSVEVTGTPVIQQKLGEIIASDRKTTQNISTLLVFIITMILFGTLTSAVVPIIIVNISVLWLYGTMGYTNLPISTLAGGVAAMVIGIGIDYAIHLMNKFKNERKRGLSQMQAIEEAVTNTGVALTGAAIATAIAFSIFTIGQMPEMGRFGMLMAIGVSFSFILSIFGLPALLIIEEKIIHAFAKKVRFGVEGEYALYDAGDIHPDEAEVVKLSENDLHSFLSDKKIIKQKRRGRTK